MINNIDIPTTNLQQLFEGGPEFLFKWMTVVGLGMYTVFALVIIKQVGIMTESVESDASGTIKFFAWIHALMAILLMVIAAVVLK